MASTHVVVFLFWLLLRRLHGWYSISASGKTLCCPRTAVCFLLVTSHITSGPELILSRCIDRSGSNSGWRCDSKASAARLVAYKVPHQHQSFARRDNTLTGGPVHTIHHHSGLIIGLRLQRSLCEQLLCRIRKMITNASQFIFCGRPRWACSRIGRTQGRL